MSLQSPPRLPGIPFLGNLPEFRKDRLALYTHMHETLGEIAEYRLLSKSFVLLSNAELIRELLTEYHHDSERSPVMLMMKPILGEGLLTTNNENNVQQRLWMNPVFHTDRFNDYANAITQKTAQFIDTLNEQRSLNFSVAMQELTLSIIGESLFSIDTLTNHTQFSKLVNDLLFATDQRLKFFFPVPLSCPLPMNRKLTQSLKPLKQLLFSHIESRRKNPDEQNDLLHYLLKVQNEQTGEKLSDNAICEQMLTFLFAGHETTATTLTWAFYSLAQNPSAYERLQNEVLSVLGNKTPELTDLKKLPYSLQVIKETLRLYPSAYAFGRTAKKDLTLGKYKIKKGQVVLVSPYIVHRRADYFENPTQFNPDRFSSENETSLTRNTWIPFGMGVRACFGRQFAMMEAQLILVLLTQKYHFELSSNEPIPLEAMITLRPGKPIYMQFQKLRAKAHL
jgi:cytochrome P450